MAPSEQPKQSPPTDPSAVPCKGWKAHVMLATKAKDDAMARRHAVTVTSPPKSAHIPTPPADPFQLLGALIQTGQPVLSPMTRPGSIVGGVRRPMDVTDDAAKRLRPENSLSPPSASSLGSSPSADSGHSSPTSCLTHDHPRADKPVLRPLQPAPVDHSQAVVFSCALSRQGAVISDIGRMRPGCAVVEGNYLARTNATSAGVPFFQEAVSIMFDSSGRLLSEPSLATHKRYAC
ncbi:hypothetical protein BC629DRAFT_1587833 [Irpex lacteus]|nr:hypothetical protein BC629DRAFT_1587833 [Irpex lacteus]